MVIAAKGQSSLEETLSECRGISADTEDPLYGCQWHLKNTGQLGFSGKEITAGEDINIEGVWNEEVYGTGINVAVVSDGIDLSHEDLSANVRSGPNYDHSDSSSFSGTRAAGVIAATGYNGLGVRGTAPGASIYSYRLSGDLSEADAVVRNKEITAVSVNGRGSEDGAFFQEASSSWEEGVELGIKKGFYGKGVFYVRGAGDGHERGDQANFNEYSSYYGVTAVCSTDGFGKKSIFSEEGVTLWVCAPGSDIVTTDNNNDYVVTSGTFLSASQVGGVAALLREINDQLSWRDIKLILAGSARQNDVSDLSWETGAVKYGSDTERYKYNPKYGFGVVDAEAAAELARSWKGVGEMRTVTAFSDKEITIPDGEGNGEGEADGVLVSRLIIPDLEETTFTEFTEVELVLSCDCLQDLNIQITSPSGTVSELVREFVSGPSDEEKNCVSYLRRTHRFGSAKHLGEDPSGEWVLKISDTASGDTENEKNTVTLHSWSIKVYGNFYQEHGSEISAKHHDLSFGGATVPDQIYRVGTQVNYRLPSASGGGGGRTYSLSPRLPAGLDRQNILVIRGTPTTVTPNTLYTLTATGFNGDKDSLTFNITVKEPDTSPTFSGATVPEQIWTEGVRIPTLRFPNATGGNGTLTYFLSPAQPVGISRQDNRLFGTPTETQRRSRYTWTVRDKDDDEDSIQFYITVRENVPTFGGQTIPQQNYIVGRTIQRLVFPRATGEEPLTYNLEGGPTNLPGGLNLVSNPTSIIGTPTTTADINYRWTVTDKDGDKTELPFRMKIRTASEVPDFGSETVEDQVWGNGRAVTLTLPQATGGDGTLNYSLSGVIPNGLIFNSNTRTLSGTLDVAAPSVLPITLSYTYKVTDSDSDDDGDSDSITFSITIETNQEPSFGGQSIPDQIYIQGTTVGLPVTLPAATGGNSPLVYSISPALPSGLSFEPATREISGAPTNISGLITNYTYKVTDSDGDTANLSFRLQIIGNTQPVFNNTITDKVYYTFTGVTETLPEAAQNNNPPSTYSLTPALPDGLRFTPATREITGTPTTAMSETDYTYTVADLNGDTDDLTFSITVLAGTDTEPTFGSESIDNKVYINGITAVTLTLPAATGGDGTLTYSLERDPGDGIFTTALFKGLTFTANTRELSGTPNLDIHPSLFPATQDHKYEVTDNDGDTAEITFSITIEEDSEPDFSGVTIPDRVYTGRTIELPEAAGGNLPVTYSITPDLPAGLRFNEVTREISGTPRSASTRTYTYTATDRNGNTDTLDFMLSVEVTSTPGPTPPRGPRTSGSDSGGGGGGCAISDQSSVASDILGVIACLILIPVSVAIRRKRRYQIKT